MPEEVYAMHTVVIQVNAVIAKDIVVVRESVLILEGFNVLSSNSEYNG